MSSSTARPTRTVRPSNKLNKDNIGELVLLSHRKFVQAAQASPVPPLESPSPKWPSSGSNSADAAWTPHSEPGSSNPGKRRHVSDSSVNDLSNGDTESSLPTTSVQPKAKHPKKKKKKNKTLHG
jgi:hypothetical protein